MKRILLIISMGVLSANCLAQASEELETYYYYDKETQTLKEIKVEKEKNPYEDKIAELTKENKKLAIKNKEWSGYYNDDTGKHEYPDDGAFSTK